MDVPRHGSTGSGRRTSPADLIELREQLHAIRASVLARAERRFRGLTSTEHELLEASTADLVEDVLRLLEERRDLTGPAGP